MTNDGSSLASWRNTPTRQLIEDFVTSVSSGPDAVPEAERIAVFDNDGTLWAEKPMPVQLHYIVQQWRAAAEADPSLTERQPYKAVMSGDLAWLGAALDKHYAGDDGDLKVIIGALVGLTVDTSVEDYARSVGEFYASAKGLATHRPYSESVYQPMIELLRYLEAHGFTCYIVSGGDRDFMRPMSEDYYGIPPERVIGSALGLTYNEDAGEVRYAASFSFMDDGPEKPVRIWSRTGRRPLLAGGNSNGDMQMLDFVLRGPRPGLALLIHHDDDSRGDTPYDAGAEKALAAAPDRGYTVVSVEADWANVFPHPPTSEG